MDRQPVLEGERLLLRPLRPDDWSALFAVASDPLIWEVHPVPDRWQEPVFRAFFTDALDQGGAMAIVDKQSGAIIGSSRWQGHDAEKSIVEIGWTFLARCHWGGSCNRELKRLMLTHALVWVETVAFCVGENNFRSRRAMEKIGGRLTDRAEVREMAGSRQGYVVYEITSECFASGPLSR